MTTSMIKRNGSSMPARPATTWVDQLLQENLNSFFNSDFPGFGLQRNNSSVPVNLRETAKSYEMELMVPGLRKEDLKIQATNDQLTISYEHQDQKTEGDEKDWLRKEYSYQSFSRTFGLDDTVDVNKISAEHANGVLKLSIPKKEHAQKISKNIEIK